MICLLLHSVGYHDLPRVPRNPQTLAGVGSEPRPKPIITPQEIYNVAIITLKELQNRQRQCSMEPPEERRILRLNRLLCLTRATHVRPLAPQTSLASYSNHPT